MRGQAIVAALWVSLIVPILAFISAPEHPPPSRSSRLFAVHLSGITLKLAVDLNWGVADRAAAVSERFTSEESLDLVHRLRRDSQAVLIGKETVIADDPSLTVRRVPTSTAQPVRIVLDTYLSLEPQKYKLFTDGLPTLIYHSESVSARCDFSHQVRCIGVPVSNGHLNLKAVVEDAINKQGLARIMVEGGPTIARSFLKQKLMDRVILIQARKVEFRDPFPSEMTEGTLEQSGLILVGQLEGGNGDSIQYWSRPDLPWPTEDLRGWP
jgi:riboflavin-specific deaminase-like protein